MPGYFRRQPAPPLDKYVDHFWVLDEFPAEAAERLVPDGTVELIINLGVTQKLYDIDDPSRFTPFRHSWLSGPRRQPIVIGSPGPSSMVGIHFRPYGAYPFLHIPMSEFADTVLDLDSIWGRDAARFRDRLGHTNSPDERFGILSSELIQRLRPNVRGEGVVQRLIARYETSISGIGTVDRTVRRRFDELVGLSPKTVERLLRFQRIIQRLESPAPIRWPAVALAEGLFDQSHLVREFREFAGLTPGEYLRRKGEYLGYLPESLFAVA